MPPNSSAWSAKNLRLLDDTDTLAHNWQSQWRYAQDNQQYMAFCRSIAGAGVPILEVAAGPGGGNLSPLLHIDPGLAIVLNDIEPGIVGRWQSLLDSVLPGHRVSFVACDVCSIPLPDAAIACVSSSGGLGTMLGSHADALSECARVLKPGGGLYAHELALTEDCIDNMPESLRGSLVSQPWLFRHWDALLRGTDLCLESLTYHERRTLFPDESPLARDAALFNYTMEVERILLFARKR